MKYEYRKIAKDLKRAEEFPKNKSEVAKKYGISRQTLYDKIIPKLIEMGLYE